MTVQTAFPNTNDGSIKRTNVYSLGAGNGISAWHVYGLTWTPTTLSWDVDGVTVYRLSAAAVPWVSSAYKDTMSIRLNLQVGGTMPAYFAKPVDSSTPFPADYQVDYVRVYDR
jgi:beta-glucanase (GH16 family)